MNTSNSIKVKKIVSKRANVLEIHMYDGDYGDIIHYNEQEINALIEYYDKGTVVFIKRETSSALKDLIYRLKKVSKRKILLKRR